MNLNEETNDELPPGMTEPLADPVEKDGVTVLVSSDDVPINEAMPSVVEGDEIDSLPIIRDTEAFIKTIEDDHDAFVAVEDAAQYVLGLETISKSDIDVIGSKLNLTVAETRRYFADNIFAYESYTNTPSLTNYKDTASSLVNDSKEKLKTYVESLASTHARYRESHVSVLQSTTELIQKAIADIEDVRPIFVDYVKNSTKYNNVMYYADSKVIASLTDIRTTSIKYRDFSLAVKALTDITLENFPSITFNSISKVLDASGLDIYKNTTYLNLFNISSMVSTGIHVSTLMTVLKKLNDLTSQQNIFLQMEVIDPTLHDTYVGHLEEYKDITVIANDFSIFTMYLLSLSKVIEKLNVVKTIDIV